MKIIFILRRIIERPFLLYICIVILAAIIFALVKAIKKIRFLKKQEENSARARRVGNIEIQGGAEKNKKSSSIGRKMRETDPSYSSEKFGSYISSAFKVLLSCLSTREFGELLPYADDEFITRVTDYTGEIPVKLHIYGISFSDYKVVGMSEYINATVHFHATVGGSRLSERDVITLRRDVGLESDVCFSLPKNACLHCGAPVVGIKCEYCGSPFRAGRYGWQICDLHRGESHPVVGGGNGT